MYKTENNFSLIKNWHIKASEEDYFSKYIFEYMAFMTFLRTQWLSEKEIRKVVGNDSKATDRNYIQILKRDSYINNYWKNNVLKSSKSIEINQTLKSLTDFLKKEPLKSDKRWWNFCGCDFNLKNKNVGKSGLLNSESDFQNLVEFWYSIRNNLFHGGKSPTSQRDRELVKFGFLTLNFFVENVLLKLKELHLIYPSIWESFWYKIETGEVKLSTFRDSEEELNINGLLDFMFLGDEHYPIVLFDKILIKKDIVNMIRNELINSGNNARKTFSKLKSLRKDERKRNELKRFFQDTVNFLNNMYNLNLSF
jgi:hypothetical protein